jgi:hypothetical protein
MASRLLYKSAAARIGLFILPIVEEAGYSRRPATPPDEPFGIRRVVRHDGSAEFYFTSDQVSAFRQPLSKPGTSAEQRRFPLPLRLLTYENGHFTCSQKRTFLLATDNSRVNKEYRQRNAPRRGAVRQAGYWDHSTFRPAELKTDASATWHDLFRTRPHHLLRLRPQYHFARSTAALE